MNSAIRLATRRSPLALAQSAWIADRVRIGTGVDVELVEILSAGDRSQAPVEQIGGTGVFAAAVRDAVLAGDADIAVHSLKDLPTTPVAGLQLVAVPARADARDTLCSTGPDLASLPPGSRIGTGSPRRAEQLAISRPDCEVVPIRGNVGSRLARIGVDLDAVVLARAGLDRLGHSSVITETLAVDVMLPAPGQGALAVEARADIDVGLRTSLATLDDPATRACITAERAMLAALGGGCTAPIAAFAHAYEPGYWQPEIQLQGGVFARGEQLKMSITGSAASAEELGQELANRLLQSGAAAMFTEQLK